MSWRLAGSLDVYRESIYRRWPGTTVHAIGDASHCPGPSDHCPNGAGVVRAIDVMDPVVADILWRKLQEIRDPRNKYNIHDEEIVSSLVSPWQVRRYTGVNPHKNHLHISVSNRAVLYDDRSPWVKREDDAMTSEERELLKGIAVDVAKIRAAIGTREGGKVLDDNGKMRRSLRATMKWLHIPDDQIEV